MSQPAVMFDGVWKKFRRGERHDSLRDLIPAIARGVLGRRRSNDLHDEEFWAVRDVSFEVQPGEALGIIGPNGAGKSTTLKLLTKILKPTQGRCEVRGRAGALIEVAAGFHPDLTGRENVYLQGAIMGMRRAGIAKHFDEIVDFAGVHEFIDTPVKRYSSGMNARLGFAIAVNLDPEVLIIDEVLSVGDMGFQRRCVQRMREFKRNGVSIVFVSHNLQAVADLCDRTVHLNGTVRCLGPTTDVLDDYLRCDPTASAEAPTTARVSIRAARLTDRAGAPVAEVTPGTDLTLSVTYGVHGPTAGLTFGLILHRSTDGLVVYDANFEPGEIGMTSSAAGEMVVDYRLRANVTRGLYHFECHVFDDATQTFLHRFNPAAKLTVHEERTWSGIADLSITPCGHSIPEQLLTATSGF
ncbi:MAG: ABC transporter ATP-binding protein [Acidobacteria bacterium]|nr:MAG: ABC transporter ATP-binding protein [Acidobacteriota bacterium]